MGNVGGKRDEGSSSGTKSEESVFMEFADGLFPESMVQSTSHSPTPNRSPLMFTPQVPMVVPQGLGNTVQTQHITTEYANMPSDKGIPTMITWAYDGSQVAIEGSWDNWKTREFLQRSGREFTIMKVLRSGVYHYRFIVDGQWKHAPELPQQLDEKGNIFNVLDLKEYAPEVRHNVSESESPPSPVASYNSSPFSLEDFKEKLSELPPLLQKTPLDQPSSSMSTPKSLEKPLSAVLDHLYIQKGPSCQSMVALTSTCRFRSKYVTVVLYKSIEKANK